MSEEQLKAFIAKVQADTSLKDQLKEVSEGDAIVAIAKVAGFSITTEDLTSYRDNLRKNLSDEELEAAAGGQVNCLCASKISAYIPSACP